MNDLLSTLPERTAKLKEEILNYYSNLNENSDIDEVHQKWSELDVKCVYLSYNTPDGFSMAYVNYPLFSQAYNELSELNNQKWRHFQEISSPNLGGQDESQS